MKTFTRLYLGIASVFFAALSVVEVRAAAGDLYFSSFINNTVRRLPPGGQASPFAAMLSRPAGLAFDRAGNLFVAEGGKAGRISKITPGGTITTFASGLITPQSVIFDSAGTLFCSDINGNFIYKFAPDGSRTTFASDLNGPSGLAFNRAGELFESDARGGTINKFSSNGTKTPFASGIDLPTGLAVDRFGNLFVAEFNKHRVIKFAPDGTPLPIDLVFDRPLALLFDSAGNLLIADNESAIIYSYSPDGNISILTAEDAPSGLAIEPPTSLPVNISTRLRVLTGDNVLIAGFILVGSEPKKVLIRGIGPSLSQFFSGVLDDPALELFQGNTLLASNNDWKETQTEVEATGIPPTKDKESAIVRTLAPGSYTAILRGTGASTGIGVVEAYDLDQGSSSQLANIASRGFVDTGNSVMICGFIIGPGNGARVLLRGIGPSLTALGVSGALADPTLELRDQNGALLKGNDNWKLSQRSEIEASGLAPANDLEAALIATLPGGNYTAVLAGASGGQGIALVELYNLP